MTDALTLGTHIKPIAHRDIARAVEESLRSVGPDLWGLPRNVVDFYRPRANWFWRIRDAAQQVPNSEAPAVDIGVIDWPGDLQVLVDLHMLGAMRTTVADEFANAVLGPNIECWEPRGFLGGVFDAAE